MVAARKLMTADEYLSFERLSEIRHEYANGEIVAMTGASEEHILITGNIHSSLHTQLRKQPCKTYMSDMRVKVSRSGAYTYPDVTVVCDTPQFEDQEVGTLLNPTVIFEVLSPSTEAYDRGDKFQRYRRLESLQEYLLVSQQEVRIEHYIRQGTQWVLTEADSLDAILTLPSIHCTLSLADVYEKVIFENAGDSETQDVEA